MNIRKLRTRSRRFFRKNWPVLVVCSALAMVLIGGAIFMHRTPSVPLKPQTTTIDSPWIPATVKRWKVPVEEMAQKYNIDPTAIAILMTLESGGYPKAESEAGAQGLLQILPATAGDIAKKYLKESVTKYDLQDPRTNIEFGTAYLAYLRDEFGDPDQGPSWNYTMELIAAGYNGGPGAAGRLYRGDGLTSTQTVSYSRDALGMWRERKQPSSPTFDRWKARGGSALLTQAEKE